ncbi:MAG: tetratricopeptide repeat protein [Haliscomenobacter sp.]|uniref:tetratricopeptide repeat protein n=1 Tax=Haliscomenobacter sp. TaxID=2717303 RepID=UPI0029B76125|nr:tetratricopeptide repeat protein [Haliscomenobacter sp.]MDX2072448.1 tetratricopeptide repeat protein [Haliscomenobacter sp.]
MKYLYALFLMFVFSWVSTAQNQSVFYVTTIPVKDYEGCKFKFSALVRIESKDTFTRAQLWLRVDKPSGRGFFEDMSERPIRTPEWKTYSIEGTIDSTGTRMFLGFLAFYGGRIFFDNFQLDVEIKNGTWKTIYKNDFETEMGLRRTRGMSRIGLDTLYKAEIIGATPNKFLKIEAPDAIEFYQKNLAALKDDTFKVNAHYLMAGLYTDKNDREKALQFYEKGLNLAYKIGFERGQLRYFYALGNMYENRIPKNYDKAAEFYKKGLEHSQKINSRKDVGAFADLLISLYEVTGNLSEGIKYIYIELKEYESLQDKPKIAESHMNLAYFTGIQKNYVKALEHYRFALNILEKLNDKNQIAQCHLTMGGIYPELGLLDSAQTSLNRSVSLFTELEGKAYYWGLPLSYLYMAKVQMKRAELSTARKETSKAPTHLKEALKYYFKSQELYRTQFSTIVADRMNIQIGIAHFKLNNPVLADSFLTLGAKALERAVYSNMLEYIEDRRDAHLYLSRVDSIRGN